MAKYKYTKISYKRSLLICTAVFAVHCALELALMCANKGRFDSNNDILLSFYAADFKLGFVNRVLIGGLISFFTDTWTSVKLEALFFITLGILCAICIPLAAKTYKKGHNEGIPVLEYGTLLFLISPFTISEFIEFWGGYDIFWVFGTIMCLFLIKKKYVRWAVPVLCFFAIFTHYGFVLAYLPVIFAVLVYEYVRADNAYDKKDIRALTITTVLVSFVSFIYFVFVANHFIQMSLDELTEYFAIKCGRELNMWYFSTNYYGTTAQPYMFDAGAYAQSEPTYSPFVALTRQFRYWLKYLNREYAAHLLAFALPLAVFFALSWLKTKKAEKNKTLKRVYVLFILIECSTLPFLFTSTDPERWFSHPLFSQFMLWYYVAMTDKSAAISLTKSIKKHKKLAKRSFCLYFISSFLFYLIYNTYYLYNYFIYIGKL